MKAKPTRQELKRNLIENINPYCDIFITVGLVSHGFQIDFYNNKGNLIGATCRDFGDSYTMKSLQACTVAALENTMNKLEKDCKKFLKRKTFKKEKS